MMTDSQKQNAAEVENNPDKFREELAAAKAPVGPPFVPLTPEALRQIANDIRKRNGLGPLPEPV